MRLIGATLVRNEADIIELSVRHNLTTLDRLAVIDHGSIDGTSEILAALVREGLPLSVIRDDSPEFDQRAMANRLVRRIFAASDADWIFPLDADEFLKVPAREELEAALNGVPGGQHVLLEWQTYVPKFDDAPGMLAMIRGARRLAQQLHGFQKVALPRQFAEAPGRSIQKGFHGVVIDGPTPIVLAGCHLSPGIAALAHFPVRSVAQFGSKIAIGWLATISSQTYMPGDSFHWQEAFGYLRSGRPLTPERLGVFAANYGVPSARWRPLDAIETIDDPFLADIEVSQAFLARDNPLPMVLAHAERLLRRKPG